MSIIIMIKFNNFRRRKRQWQKQKEKSSKIELKRKRNSEWKKNDGAVVCLFSI